MLWLPVLVYFLQSVRALSLIQRDSLQNIQKIISWQGDTRYFSPQFALGASIGRQLLIGSSLSTAPEVTQLMHQLKDIEDTFQETGVKLKRTLTPVAHKLINSSLWMDKPLQIHPLTNAKINPSPWSSLTDYLANVDTGHPNEVESDYCLQNRMSSCDNDTLCYQLMAAKDASAGYRATHKYRTRYFVNSYPYIYDLFLLPQIIVLDRKQAEEL